jgi:hypothetical protein
VNHAEREQDMSGLEPESPPPEVARDGDGRVADSQAAAMLAELRWSEGKGTLPTLDSIESAKLVLAELTKFGLREIRRCRRASEPVPPALLAALARVTEAYLKAEMCLRDTSILAETRRLLKQFQQRRGLPSGASR